MYVWGYITGSSEAQVVAESGATIYEKMQVADYRGGNGTTDLASNRFFPFSQYYIQNIEEGISDGWHDRSPILKVKYY